ncbi:unnamed protein product, partial [Prorocentrum cordatum]
SVSELLSAQPRPKRTAMALTLGGDPVKPENSRISRRRVEDGEQPKIAKTAAGYNPANKSLMVLIMKMIMQLAQSRRTVEGILFDVIIAPQDMPEVTRMAEQGANYNEQALLNRQESIGKASYEKLKELKQRLGALNYEERMDIIKFTKLDRCFNQQQGRIALCLGGCRKEIIGALVQLGGELKSGRAPATHMEREMQEWLEAFPS